MSSHVTRSSRLAMSSLLVLVSLACRPDGPTKPPKDPCADFEVEIERFWSASIKAKVLDRGGEVALARRSGVTNKMDRISEDWVRMRTSVCKDHFVRGTIDQQQYAARVQCFDDRLDRQRTLATALTADGGSDLTALESAIDELLAAPASCASPAE